MLYNIILLEPSTRHMIVWLCNYDIIIWLWSGNVILNPNSSFQKQKVKIKERKKKVKEIEK